MQTAGRIELRGRDISTLPPAQRDYGIVFQSYALFPNLSVADNVAYGLVNRKMPQGARSRSASSELVKLVGPAGQRRQVSRRSCPAASSSASRWRARSATSPGLLLLDEPLSALDALERVRLRQEIRALQRKLGVTTIMVTHDQEEALSVADRIVVMNHGVIEQVGTPLEIYREPAIALRRRLRRQGQRAAGDAGDGSRAALRRRARFDCPHDGAAGPRGARLPAARGRAGAADRRR